MAGTSRIDELRKKFDENPRRYFAPLANEYRKIGDFEQAIFICQEFLPQQPGHMSGHIVYGQALFESGRHDEARSVFETALALDPENLIALRHLGDIARAHGDTETASAWYRRVLESDPRNEEIAGILTSLDSDVPTSSAPAPGSEGVSAGNEGQGVADAPLSMESAISAATGADAPGANADPIVTEPLTSAPAESSFDDIAKLFTSGSSSAAAPSAPVPSAAEEKLDLIHEGEDVLSGTQGRPEEPPLLSAHDEPRASEAPPHADAAATSSAEAPPPSFGLPFLEVLTSSQAPGAPPPAPEPPQAAEAEPTTPTRSSAPDASTAFVTETMAELYVKQGHHEQAIEVYRQLVQLHPNDSELAARLRSLERGATADQPAETAAEAVAEAGPTIREFLGSIAGFRLQSGDVASDNSAAPAENGAVETPNETRAAASGTRTVGGSLNELFSGAEQDVSRQAPAPVADVGVAEALIAAQEGAAADTKPLSGRPSKPAATELSLDHVFRHATPAAGSSAHSSFSFDQFFSEQAQQDVAASEGVSGAEESGGLSDDIQQFNAWLEGLKKS